MKAITVMQSMKTLLKKYDDKEVASSTSQKLEDFGVSKFEVIKSKMGDIPVLMFDEKDAYEKCLGLGGKIIKLDESDGVFKAFELNKKER